MEQTEMQGMEKYPIRLKLRINLPVNAKHGMTAGRVVRARLNDAKNRRGAVVWWAWGDTGEEVGIQHGEAGVVTEDE